MIALALEKLACPALAMPEHASKHLAAASNSDISITSALEHIQQLRRQRRFGRVMVMMVIMATMITS